MTVRGEREFSLDTVDDSGHERSSLQEQVLKRVALRHMLDSRTPRLPGH